MSALPSSAVMRQGSAYLSLVPEAGIASDLRLSSRQAADSLFTIQ
jgi:hypothetical protein